MKRRTVKSPRRIKGKKCIDNKSRSAKGKAPVTTASKMFTAEETADLFLSELTASDATVPTDVSTAPSATRSGPTTSSKKKSAKKGKSAAVTPKAKRRVTTVPTEEGEEDPSVTGDVLQRAAAFLSRLSPAQSKQFWALRQVARGEKDTASVPVAEVMEDDSSDEADEEEASSETSTDDADDNDDVSSDNEKPKSGGEVMVDKVKGKMKRGGGGGSLFVSNGDMWDD